MPNLPAAFFFVSAVLSAVLVFAETPGQATKPAPAPMVDSEAAAPVVESRLHVELKDDLLSIDLMDAEFGSVMKAISARAGIKLDMSGPLQQKRLTTKFSNIELERGIIRLMTLMKEKNYTMRYDPRGRVSVIEVYGAEPPVASPSKTNTRTELQKTPQRPLQKTLQPAAAPSERPVSGVQKNPPQQRRLIPPSKPAVPQADPSAQSSPNTKKTDPYNEDEVEEEVQELPYTAPQKKMPAATK